MAESTQVPLWERTAQETAGTDRFEPDGEVDVAVVGAGYTGLSTALHCAAKGLSVQVVEAGEIGHGGSGRNVGLVNAGVWMPPDEVEKTLGATYGPRFLRRFCDGPEVVFDLIEKHQIRCEATRSGTVHAAHAPSGLRDLERRQAVWQRMGEPVDLLGPDEVARIVGSKVFHGGLLDHRAGTINPMGYCRGLARAARAAGARVSTGMRATKLTPEGRGWEVATDRGPVRAAQVVLGTNAYTDDLWPGLSAGFKVIHYLQFATPPLGLEADHILPGRQGLWDTGRIMFNCRRDAEGRLLIGTMGRVIGTQARGLTRRWAARQVARVFPELGPVAFEAAWHGRIAMTPDHLPRIHRLAEGLFTPIGYNGRGITTGTLFGQAMADLLTGTDPADLPLPMTEPAAVPRAGVMTRLYDVAFTANQVWRGLR